MGIFSFIFDYSSFKHLIAYELSDETANMKIERNFNDAAAIQNFSWLSFIFETTLLLLTYGVYISQIIRFARVSSHVADFNARKKYLTAKLLQQGYRYHKLRKTFSKFYRRHYELISKFNVRLKHFCTKAYRNRNFMVT